MHEERSSVRPLREEERALLDHLLQVDIPGIEELRAQAAWAGVDEEASRLFDLVLRVPDEAPPARQVLDNHPVRCFSKDDNLDIELEMDGYYLGGIYVGYSESEPTRLPRPEELQTAFRSRLTG